MNIRLKGHESFYFREGWLEKGIYEISNAVGEQAGQLFKSHDAIAKLGVGNNMVKSIKYWMIGTGLIQNVRAPFYGVEFTELGRIIAANDPYFEDYFSLWLMHINLVSDLKSYTTWYLFFNEFSGQEFTSLQVKSKMSELLNKYTDKYIEKSLEQDIQVLLNMYSKSELTSNPEENYRCPLASLQLLKNNKDKYYKVIPDFRKISPLIVLYAIKKKINDDSSISIDLLESGEGSLNAIFNFDRMAINEYLDTLANMGYLKVVKTAGLDSVTLTSVQSETDIINDYYHNRGEI